MIGKNRKEIESPRFQITADPDSVRKATEFMIDTMKLGVIDE